MKTMRERIVDLYGPAILQRSAINIRGGAGVFEAVLAGKGYRTVLEIGTHRGCGTAEIAQFVEHVVTIDLHNGRLEKRGEPFDREELWRRLGVNNVSMVLVEDDDEKEKVVAGLDFDLAFIDGSHEYADVRRDFRMVRRCGRVLFHDCDRNNPGQVLDFVDSLPADQRQQLDIFVLWTAPNASTK